MLTLNRETTVGEIVRECPSRARVFESYKIDYCCGGKMSLADACRRREVDPDEVLDQLRDCDEARDDANGVDADSMTLTELADHVEQTHHAYLREELPRLDYMTEKVLRVHGEHEPRLQQVRDAFLALRAELEPHMLKEERILFPLVRALESGKTPQPEDVAVARAIHQMEHEHDQAGDSLEILRESTDDFVAPEWACNTYRAMLSGLEQLERDLHQHIHKENNVLFPKAIQLEARP